MIPTTNWGVISGALEWIADPTPQMAPVVLLMLRQTR